MTESRPTGYSLRHPALTDLPAVYRICLRTADIGDDASATEDDPDAAGHIYAGPYVALEPQHAFVLDGPNGVAGYAVGVLDTNAFYERMERDWLPALRRHIPNPGPDESRWRGSDARRWKIHQRQSEPAWLLERYPSHAHINLYAEARGGGNGRRILEAVMQTLVDAGSPGIHLGVARHNVKALAFYRALGLEQLPVEDDAATGVYVVKRFKP